MFRRLGRNISPSKIWIRNTRGTYVLRDTPGLSVGAGTLCQIGVHLSPGPVQTGGRFCQIVSGPNRGLRFEFKAEDFFQDEEL
ncbi:hypothetical protein GCM10023212_09100 [Luteolibacter yonseiensis]